MIRLTISKHDKKQQELKTRLEDMHLARKITEVEEQSEAVLVHGDNTYQGIKAIINYYEELEGVMTEWYACRCGNHGEND